MGETANQVVGVPKPVAYLRYATAHSDFSTIHFGGQHHQPGHIMVKRRISNRWIPISMIAVLWLVIGMTAPILLSVSDRKIETQTTSVVAAPRHTHIVSAPLKLGLGGGLVLESGNLSLSDESSVDRTLKERDAIIEEGRAQMVLADGEIALFGGIASGTGSDPMQGPEAPLAAATRELNFQSLTVKSGAIAFAMPNGTRERISSAEVVIEPSRDRTSVSMKGKGFWRGLPATFEIAHRKAGPNAQAVARAATDPQTPDASVDVDRPVSRVSFSLRAKTIALAFTGTVMSGAKPVLRGQTRIEATDFSQLAGLIGGSFDAGSRLKNVRLEGESVWQNGRLVFQTAQLAIGRHVATGSLAIAQKEDEPNISGTLDFKTFDIADLIVAGSRDETAEPSLEDWWRIVWEKLRNPMRAPLGIDLRLSADQLMLGSANIGRSAMTLSLHKGQLRAQLAEFAFAGGQGSGELGINFNRARSNITIGGAVNNADLAAVNRLLPKSVAMPLQGQARIEVDLTTEGSTEREALSGLAGTVRVRLPAGGTLKLDTKKLSEVSSSKPYADLSGATDIEKFSAELAFFNGQAFCRNLKAATATHVIEGAGSLDLASLDVAFLGGVRKKPPPSDAANQAGAQTNGTGTAAASEDQADAEEKPEPTFSLKGTIGTLKVAPYLASRDKDLLSIMPLFQPSPRRRPNRRAPG